MNSVISAVKHTVPISLFNRGQAGKIFEEVKRFGAKVVMKNNIPECVLLSPEEYTKLMDELEDAELALLAKERLKNFDPKKVISAEKLYQELGITDEDLKGFEDVELE